jgi:hypothetical protein
MGKTSLDLSILFRKQDFCALPKTKTGVLSSYICLLVLTLRYDCTEMSADGIWKREPCAELRGVLPEAAKEYMKDPKWRFWGR